MVKKSLLIVAAAGLLAGNVKAQTHTCATDEAMRQARLAHPEIAEYEAQLEAQIQEGLKHLDLRQFAAAKGTVDSIPQPGVIQALSPRDINTYEYHIPIVVHIIHDYGTENITDDAIYQAVKDWNTVYAKQNADTSDVIAPFKKYIGNPRIVLHLANKDPHGNPTKGIVRHQHYLSINGGDQAKLDGWPNNAYLNIWVVKLMPAHSNAAAYAYYPSAAQAPAMAPYDGVITLFDYFNNDKTINHEIGHCMNLKHTWGDTNDPEVGCGDDDVDDTPPTKGHSPQGCTPAALYDTTCATGYLKHYVVDSIGPDNNTYPKDTIIDYPDTVNAQNIMDYTYCSRMFTLGQVLRMHQALNLDVANRNNLWSQRNLAATGLLPDSTYNSQTSTFIPMADLAPIPDFSVEIGKVSSGVPPSERTFFGCANNGGLQFGLTNRSWGDTVTKVDLSFSNGASTPTTTLQGGTLSSTIYNTFSQPGWVNVTMNVYGNGPVNGTTPATSTRQSFYVADGDNPIVVDPNISQYYMEFNPGTTDNWPIFNYYNNEFKWKLRDNVGFYDHTCIEYTGFDGRAYPANETGSPGGDKDDFFSPAFNLTSMSSGDCNLNFMSAATFRTGNPADMKDSLLISYSIDCGRNWIQIAGLGKNQLANNGSLTIAYEPLGSGEWVLHSINIPAQARTNKTFFRFRYKPGTDGNQNSTGNNFYLDRINIGNFPLGVNTMVNGDHNIAVAPNPTTGSSYVIISNLNSGTAHVTVTDLAGRVVFTTSQALSSNVERVEIPASVLKVKGMYMVHVNTDTQSFTEKLVSY